LRVLLGEVGVDVFFAEAVRLTDAHARNSPDLIKRYTVIVDTRS